ncbi:bifunctional DNA-formamidopyrimidine glycosylase/DNA-(apurinic or apyrimidinic site) lyase [Lactobacillus helsingborgensis]|uniref:bifunctional DNA-formamidopyrimidine glycosylase/DNA-(apurinic or apyrimidinic site) lyase n=1 Tax=Lactobacillus helsingborgensis TaxID=1218494 RepID=UPI0016500D77|nr:bifunctional DNA-formamidopyrimidine glycosylase/DNA-(apurinic or apyrimidinic site) lyase [Lactobacillus helsingborgensis]MBC6355826.1 bifunctional DNA-formamidopyrimidine glycosylase/DNA-(apurinic or apyrimidinic site) lyase [Lactobacillus helsingborgensis]MCT6827245.1 bifunctional DNA-formamidopyrimidine glycosylase/DNA-(apurinic or apyrimidinic site) lyase [Lactobacillus helsingborgensis]
MPEMPEVETVRRTLLPLIKGKTIKEVTVWYPKIITGDAKEFKRQLVGKKITTIDRYAKYLLIRLSGNLTVVSHLRMEGKYRLVKINTKKDKHDHVQIVFSDNSALRYNDVRKFGRMQLIKTGTEKEKTGISKLGAEPNSAAFTVSYLQNGLARKKKNIKNTLLDQSVVAGLGNIYVDEVLWETKIHPLSQANTIPAEKVAQLHDNINSLIELAIAERGTTIHTYLDANGKTGGFQKMLQVYGHKGEPCVRCGTPLEKIKVNGRGTTFCPKCQVIYK